MSTNSVCDSADNQPYRVLDNVISNSNDDTLLKIKRLKQEYENVDKQIKELERVQKEMEEQSKKQTIESEFDKQRNFLINKFKEFPANFRIGVITNEEICAILFKSDHAAIRYYFKESDKNTLLVKQYLNRFAKMYGIRYEDALEVMKEFLQSVDDIATCKSNFEYVYGDYENRYQKVQKLLNGEKNGRSLSTYDLQFIESFEKEIPLFC